MMHDPWNNNNNTAPPLGFQPTKSAPCSPIKPLPRTSSESFHVAHKVPVGDTPYVKAKHVQLVDKDPEKAIALFWAAINAGDRVDSALKDMAIVMKQHNRAEEAIEAIKSLRGRCSEQAQESLDNILLDLYKKCGRLDDQIALLKHKLFLIQQGLAFNGKRTKTARSQGKKFQVSVEQEATRLLGNLGWAYMQQNSYIEAEEAYRRALSVAPDNNKMCNLGICLMKQGRIAEAKDTLRRVRPAVADGPRGVDSHLKAFEGAREMLRDLESEIMIKAQDQFNQSQLFDAFLGSSSIWQPQPCVEQPFIPPSLPKQQDDGFGDENLDLNRIVREGVLVLGEKQPPPGFPPLSQMKTNKSTAMILPPPFTQTAPKHHEEVFADENLDLNRLLREEEAQSSLPPPLHKIESEKTTMCLQHNFLAIDAPPFYSKFSREQPIQQARFLDPLSCLKRTRSGKLAAAPARKETQVQILVAPAVDIVDQPEQKSRRRSQSFEGNKENNWLALLPDNKELDDAIVAAIIAPYKEKKRFKVFQDITASLELDPYNKSLFFE